MIKKGASLLPLLGTLGYWVHWTILCERKQGNAGPQFLVAATLLNDYVAYCKRSQILSAVQLSSP